MRTIFVSSLCLILFAACGTKQVNLGDQSSDSLRTVLLREVEYDEKGMPLFVKTLNKRPVNPGERFTVGLFRGDTPVKTFDIAIKRSHGDYKVPLRIVYNWTGKGFTYGAAVGFILASLLADASTEDNGNKDLELMAGGLVAGAVVGTAGGFVIGLAASTPSAVAETEKAILRAQESIVTYTEYEYNDLGRLRNMIMYEPETREPIVRTDFYYEDGRNIPVQTEVRSYPENKVRIIDQSGTREVEVRM